MKRYALLMAAALSTVLTSPLRADEAAVTAATTGNNAFAAELFQQLDKTHADKNLFLSPFSISSALSMTAQGAGKKTFDQMTQVLHFSLPVANNGLAFFQAGMAEISTQLLGTDAKRPYELSVANGLWVDQTFPLSAGFVEASKKNFQAGVNAVDFVHNAQAARKLINDTIASQTHDKITDLIPQGSVDASTALVLTNAIYFKGTWETQFDKKATTDQPFHAPGKDVDVPMMKSPASSTFAYAETDDVQTLTLPYKVVADAGKPDLSMVIILPKKVDGLAAVEKQLTPETLSKWTAAGGGRRQPVQVFLPGSP